MRRFIVCSEGKVDLHPESVDILQNVLPEDLDIFRKLITNKVIPTYLTSTGLRKNPHYQLEDKLIQLYTAEDGVHIYHVPYNQYSRMRRVDCVYWLDLTIDHNEGTIQVEGCKPRPADRYTTLKNDFIRAKGYG